MRWNSYVAVAGCWRKSVNSNFFGGILLIQRLDAFFDDIERPFQLCLENGQRPAKRQYKTSADLVTESLR